MFSTLADAHDGVIPVRRWTAMASFTTQAAIVSVALVYSLLHLDSLPPVSHPVLLPIITQAAPIQRQGPTAQGSAASLTEPIIVHTYRPTMNPTSTPSHDGDAAVPPAISILGSGRQGPGVESAITNGYVPPTPVAPPPEICAPQ